MTGYVALQAAPERGAHTHRLFEQLDTALDALVVARAEVNRLIGEAQK